MNRLTELRVKIRGVDPDAPVRVPPPRLAADPLAVDDGCLICGVWAVDVAPDRVLWRTVDREELHPFVAANSGRREPLEVDEPELARDVPVRELSRRLALWRAVVCEPTRLGAPPLGARLRGWACPACHALREEHPLGAALVLARLRQVAPDGAIPSAGYELTTLRRVTFASRVVLARLELRDEPIATSQPFGWLDLDDVQVADDDPYPDAEVTRLDAGQPVPVLKLGG